MKLTISPTPEFFMASAKTGDVMVRAWKGADEEGREVIALLAGVAAPDTEPGAEATRHPALIAIPPPGPVEDRDATVSARYVRLGPPGETSELRYIALARTEGWVVARIDPVPFEGLADITSAPPTLISEEAWAALP
jgi:hypothetical protein